MTLWTHWWVSEVILSHAVANANQVKAEPGCRAAIDTANILVAANVYFSMPKCSVNCQRASTFARPSLLSLL
jgi:hypothetical protein